jgi:hypothetical protein
MIVAGGWDGHAICAIIAGIDDTGWFGSRRWTSAFRVGIGAGGLGEDQADGVVILEVPKIELFGDGRAARGFFGGDAFIEGTMMQKAAKQAIAIGLINLGEQDVGVPDKIGLQGRPEGKLRVALLQPQELPVLPLGAEEVLFTKAGIVLADTGHDGCEIKFGEE